MTILVNKVETDPDKAEVLGRGELQVMQSIGILCAQQVEFFSHFFMEALLHLSMASCFDSCIGSCWVMKQPTSTFLISPTLILSCLSLEGRMLGEKINSD